MMTFHFRYMEVYEKKLIQLYTRASDRAWSMRPILRSDFLDGVCARRVWSRLRLINGTTKTAQAIRVEKSRQWEKKRLLAECEALGWVIHAEHPKTRLPIVFKDDWVEIRMSAMGKDPSGELKGWFLIEVEGVDQELFERVIEHRVETAYPSLYAHCQLGLGHSKLNECAVFLSSPKGEVYFEVLPKKDEVFTKLSEKAREMFRSDVVPDKVLTQECTGCEFYDACYDPVFIPHLACQTCCYAQLKASGISCQRWKRDIEPDVWREGCGEHVFIPHLLNFTDRHTMSPLLGGVVITYSMSNGQVVRNGGEKAVGEGLYTSKEMTIGGVEVMTDPMILQIKQEFKGSQVIQKQEKQDDNH